ncbi:MAG: carbamoyl-phosphate synthase large subunit, partial [Clostridia bacterium]|nr:carbamoyl-phosphate synthase large subunit [Clostridia bacterium]
ATIRDEDKEEALPILREFGRRHYEIYATKGTCKFLNEHGVKAELVNTISGDSPNIADLLRSGEVNLVINTPSKGSDHQRDGFRIRRCAVEASVPCLTSLDTAKALLISMGCSEHYEDDIVDITRI